MCSTAWSFSDGQAEDTAFPEAGNCPTRRRSAKCGNASRRDRDGDDLAMAESSLVGCGQWQTEEKEKTSKLPTTHVRNRQEQGARTFSEKPHGAGYH